MPTYLRTAPPAEVVKEWPLTPSEQEIGAEPEARADVERWQPYCLITLTALEAGEVLYRCGDDHFPVRICPCLCPDSLQHQTQYLRDHGHLLARPIIRKGADGLYVVHGAHRLRVAFDSGSGVYETFCGSEAPAKTGRRV